MADWSLLDREWLPAPPPAPYNPYQYTDYDPYYQEKPQQPSSQQPPLQHPLPPPAQQSGPFFSPPSPSLSLLVASSSRHHSPPTAPMSMLLPIPYMPFPKGDNPREIRNKAEKQRRDKLNHSISELASMVPPVVAASRKIDKTGVLRLTAHYLRAHQYVFGDSIGHADQFTPSSTRALLKLLNGFLFTITYKGLIVVVSENVKDYLGYNEMDLLGQNIFTLTHEDDRQMLKDQLMPRSQKLGTNGELLMPEEGAQRVRVAQALANEKRRFTVRFKKLGQRSEPTKYLTCNVEGSLRKSDRACHGYNRCCQMVRRARARGDNPYSSGNDVVFIGVVRPTTETFINESAMESYNMEYRTRHSVDGEIIQCDQRIALVTGYMTHEVNGVNAMNFIHRDEVRWVIVTLRDMYDHNLLYGESCYRLITKNGQFIYLRTRGRLDVVKGTRAVTSFVCTNTVVDENEGKQLIKMMKEKFKLSDNNTDSKLSIEETKDMPDSLAVSVEDPIKLKKEILSLVTNLPSLDSSPPASTTLPGLRLAIIPPKKERIFSAIEKIYTVIKSIPKQQSIDHKDTSPDGCCAPSLNPNYFPSVLPSNRVHLQSQISSGTEATFSPVTSSECDYLTVGTVYDEVMPYNYNSAQMNFNMFPPQERFTEQLFSKPIQPGPSATGMKRHNFDERQDTSSKKKVTNTFHEVDANEQISDRNSPSLETFFDEAILNTQIESAIDSLEYTIDPSFPDLLISNEVQDILEKIEERDEDIDI